MSKHQQARASCKNSHNRDGEEEREREGKEREWVIVLTPQTLLNFYYQGQKKKLNL